MSKFRIYAQAILIPVLLGALVGFLISGFMDYETLQKPAFAPPGIIFPIMWTILYILMGVSYGIIKDKAELDFNTSLVYYLQLFVNLLWPIAFFVLKWRLFAFIWIVLLLILVVLMAAKFYHKNKLAGLLQIPYIAWTAFATYLNLGIFLLNG